MRINFHSKLHFLQTKQQNPATELETYTAKWEDRKTTNILFRKVEVSFSLGISDRYIDESKDILKSIIISNDDVTTDSDGEQDDV